MGRGHTFEQHPPKINVSVAAMETSGNPASLVMCRTARAGPDSPYVTTAVLSLRARPAPIGGKLCCSNFFSMGMC